MRRSLILIPPILALAGCESNSDAERDREHAGRATPVEIERFFVRMQDDAAELQVAVRAVLKGDTEAVDRIARLHKRIRARAYDYLVATGHRSAAFLALDLAAVGARSEADTGDLDGLRDRRLAIVKAREMLANEADGL